MTAPSVPTSTGWTATPMRVAVVGALSATSMLFASLASAFLLRRSFSDWEVLPGPRAWSPLLLLCGIGASLAIEWLVRSPRRSERALVSFVVANAAYLIAAVLVVRATIESGLKSPHAAFVALLLSLHVLHAVLGAAFSFTMAKVAWGEPGSEARELARIVTHFLTLLLSAIVALLLGVA